ncbi:uroporphyrinogen-III synthase [Paecilomyces variotii No. 5]|uniref:Uroporphyrinogen-III synthase n=1 Tax=Byssochlamys spectabilis (strain No. 5 / NBRC 109023) TaxID=1356009 RepID=V5F9W9_BYSSN|nr:uroporphyrinogen-III synthase [Paecilomyces variotii No. 5]
MAISSQSASLSKPPVFLLKTKSTPHDGYEEYFSSRGYNPTFVPVLEHRFHDGNLKIVKNLFTSGQLDEGSGRKYGGLIFTSQRAVEGFTRIVEEVGVSKATSASKSLILYTVGPATSRSLSSIQSTHLPHAQLYGSEAGNGENLARMILEHYNGLYGENENGTKPSLLFLVGEQRRDIIPRTLMDESLPSRQRIQVDELVVYETGVMDSFEEDFARAVQRGRDYLSSDGEGKRAMWTVVFSPTGCDAMLKVLDLLPGEKSKTADEGRREFVTTIGPTTRDHLRSKYGFDPDVCAEKPSPEGVGGGIEAFMGKWEGQLK